MHPRSGETFRVIERHTRVDADALEYRATAEDPAVYVYTRPFTVLRELTRDDGCAMGRWQCHEYNDFMRGMFAAGRADER